MLPRGKLIGDSRIDPHTIAGVGICGFHHCPVLVDEDGAPVRPVILLHDQRLVSAREEMAENGIINQIEKRTLSMISAGHFPSIASFLQQSEPEGWSQFRWILLPKDYLRFRLTDEIATELCDATGLNLIVPGETSWDTDLCGFLDLTPERLPTIHESHELARTVSPGAASDIGLVAGTPGASVLTWACERFAGAGIANAEEMASGSPPGSRGVTFLPYIYGERSPFYDPDATGAFLGLRHWHTSDDLIRSVFEGVAMNVANCYDLATECGVAGDTHLGSVRLGGGGSTITMWHQLIADSIGVPIHIMSVREDLTICPIPENTPIYGERRAKMNELYRRLA